MSDNENDGTKQERGLNDSIDIKVCVMCCFFVCGGPADCLVSRPPQVLTSAGEEVFFKIKRRTKLSKLQGAYANKVGKDVSTIRYASPSRHHLYATPSSLTSPTSVSCTMVSARTTMAPRIVSTWRMATLSMLWLSVSLPSRCPRQTRTHMPFGLQRLAAHEHDRQPFLFSCFFVAIGHFFRSSPISSVSIIARTSSSFNPFALFDP